MMALRSGGVRTAEEKVANDLPVTVMLCERVFDILRQYCHFVMAKAYAVNIGKVY